MEPAFVERWTVNGRHPRSAMRVTVREASHCAKALMRSKLWEDDYRIERAELPSYAQMLKDQNVTTQSVEELQASIDELRDALALSPRKATHRGIEALRHFYFVSVTSVSRCRLQKRQPPRPSG